MEASRGFALLNMKMSGMAVMEAGSLITRAAGVRFPGPSTVLELMRATAKTISRNVMRNQPTRLQSHKASCNIIAY